MAYADLRDFLRRLEREGELRHVSAPVDPHLEVTEIVTRVVRDGGPALVFDQPQGASMPLAINLFGTERRMAMALGVDSLDEIGDRIGDAAQAGDAARLRRRPRGDRQARVAARRAAQDGVAPRRARRS